MYNDDGSSKPPKTPSEPKRPLRMDVIVETLNLIKETVDDSAISIFKVSELVRA